MEQRMFETAFVLIGSAVGSAIFFMGLAFGGLLVYNRRDIRAVDKKDWAEGVINTLVTNIGKQSAAIIDSQKKALNASLVSSERQIDRINAETLSDAVSSRSDRLDRHREDISAETNFIDASPDANVFQQSNHSGV